MVPGLSCESDGVPDVLRGEEVQVFGAIDLNWTQGGMNPVAVEHFAQVSASAVTA